MSKPKGRPFADYPAAEILEDVPNGGTEDRSLGREYLIELAARVARVLAACGEDLENYGEAAIFARRIKRLLDGEDS